jgi:hypothetical protein
MTVFNPLAKLKSPKVTTTETSLLPGAGVQRAGTRHGISRTPPRLSRHPEKITLFKIFYSSIFASAITLISAKSVICAVNISEIPLVVLFFVRKAGHDLVLSLFQCPFIFIITDCKRSLSVLELHHYF